MSSPLQSYEKEEQAIDLGSGEGSTLLMKGTAGTNERRTKIMWGVLVLVSCIAALSVSAHVSSSRSDPGKETGAVTSDENGRTAPMQAATSEHKFSACNLASCTGSGCAWDSAPYLCTDGSSVGGCAADASAWAPENGACIAFCDLSDCSDILDKAEAGGDGAEALPRRCGECDDTQCAVIAGQWSQACGKAAPFMCLSGSATWGCSDTELAWASVPATTCGECCNVEGCAGDR